MSQQLGKQIHERLYFQKILPELVFTIFEESTFLTNLGLSKQGKSNLVRHETLKLDRWKGITCTFEVKNASIYMQVTCRRLDFDKQLLGCTVRNAALNKTVQNPGK